MPSLSSLVSVLALMLSLVGAQDTTTTPTDGEIEAVIRGITAGFRGDQVSSIVHFPEEVGLEYENVTFTSEDGVELKGWFFPRKDSNKIIIANHPRWFNRAGINAREPDEAVVPGNYWEVDFVTDYKILHNAGYNVLTYDIRNHGESGITGIYTSGVYESRDVVASINYVQSREDTKGMTMGLFSRCNGANSNLHAVRLYPDAFKDIQAMVLVQPLSANVFMSRAFENQGIPRDYLAELDRRVRNSTGFSIYDFTPAPSAAHVQVPTFVYQVRDDYSTRPSDVQTIFDNIPIENKKLYWIEGTDKRWDGYTYFQDYPEQNLEWFAQWMA